MGWTRRGVLTGAAVIGTAAVAYAIDSTLDSTADSDPHDTEDDGDTDTSDSSDDGSDGDSDNGLELEDCQEHVWDECDPQFSLSIVDAPETVEPGHDIDIDFEIENSGGAEGHTDVTIEATGAREASISGQGGMVYPDDTFENDYTLQTSDGARSGVSGTRGDVEITFTVTHDGETIAEETVVVTVEEDE